MNKCLLLRATGSVFLTMVAAGCDPSAQLLVVTDLDCDLRIDGEARGALPSSAPKRFDLFPGQHLVSCAAGDFSFDMEISAEAGRQTVATIELKAQADAVARQAELQRRQEELQEILATRFVSYEEGVVLDRNSSLQWTEKPGQELGKGLYNRGNWHDATDYCAKNEESGGGWRLPTKAELDAISNPIPLDDNPRFNTRLMFFLWSSEGPSASQAYVFDTTFHRWEAWPKSRDRLSSALCTRESVAR